MQLDEKRQVIIVILGRLRDLNPAIGTYEKSILSSDLKYHIKLSNGRLLLPLELVDDFEKHPGFITDDELKRAAAKFQQSEPNPTQKPESTPQQEPVKTQVKKRTLKRILVYSIAAIIVVSLASMGMAHYKETQDKDFLRSNILTYVTAEGSEYTYNSLGGIYDFKVTVNNGTKYNIDNVRIIVRYIKADGETWKEEPLDFNYLPPYETRTIAAPDSDRGIKVSFKIVSISSTELGLF